MRVVAAQATDFPWLAERASCGLTDRARGIKAIDFEGNIKGMVAFDGWTETACQVHFAAESPIAWRSLITAFFDYPFRQCGKNILFGAIPSHNRAALRHATRLGGEVLGRVRDGWAKGDDLVLFEIRKVA